MLSLLYIKKFIHSSKNLKEYIKKLTSADLINLLDDLDELIRFSKKRKNDKNPLIRTFKRNLSEHDYLSFMGKLALFPHEKQVFTLTQKETVLHFLSILSAILLGSFSGFVGLLAALDIVFSAGILSILVLAVFAISLLIAITWSYQVRISDQETTENKKLLNFHIEILKNYNSNKINKILVETNRLKNNLELKDQDIKYNTLTNISGDIQKTDISPYSTKSITEIEKNKKELAEKLNAILVLIKKKSIDKTFKNNRDADDYFDNHNFITWFKIDTSRILLNLFNQSKNLLASVALGAVSGLAILKLLSQVTILTTLLTTYLGIGILVGIIVIVVLSSMVFSLYEMYKNSRRSQIKNNALAIIESEKEIKTQLENIEKELEQLSSLASSKPNESSTKAYDTVSMQELMEADETKNKFSALKKLLTEKNLDVPKNQQTILASNPLLILKLIKKIKDQIITTNEELDNFLQKYKLETSTTSKFPEEVNLAKPINSNSTTSPEEAFYLAKSHLTMLSNPQLLLAVEFIENQILPKKPYTFDEGNAELIQNIAAEIAKRLNKPNFLANSDLLNLRKGLENYKSMRKKVKIILLEENTKLQNCFKDYIAVLDKQSLPPLDNQPIVEPNKSEESIELLSVDNESDVSEHLPSSHYTIECNKMKTIEASLKFDPHTITINELINKKWTAAKSYKEKSTIAQEKPCFNFWQQPQRQNQKVTETFEQLGVNFKKLDN